MTYTERERLESLVERQYGVISRDQVLGLGMTRRAVDYRVRPGGPWQRLLPGIYLAQTGASDLRQRMMAAQLYAGPGSVITGLTAFVYNGLGARELGLIDVLVPVARHRLDIGFVRLQRTARMPATVLRKGPLRFAPVARAVIDTARGLTSVREVRAVIADPVQIGRCSVRELIAELAAGPIRDSALTRSVLVEVGDGVRSAAEGDLLGLLRRSGLPMPLLNPSLYVGDMLIAKPDAWWPDAGAVAEVDSREWHFRSADWEATMVRHNKMTALGILLMHFPPTRLRLEPLAVIGEMRDTYAQGLQRGPLPIRTVPCAS